jgi:hypothetical protein
MTQYGSLMNMLQAGARSPEPEVGMGATILMWSDRHAATIVEVVRYKTGQRAGEVKGVWIQADTATRTDSNGMSDAQSYTYAPNADAPRVYARRTAQGGYVLSSGSRLGIGYRENYYDYSF